VRRRDANDLVPDDVEVDSPRQPDRFFEPRLDRPLSASTRILATGRFRCRMDDEGTAVVGRALGDFYGSGGDQGSPNSLFPSNNWIGCAGITVEMACL
jgi:hypothetical protein